MKDFEKWIRKQINYYAPILGVDINEIKIEKKQGDDSYISIANTYPYLDPTLYYSDSAYKDWKKGELKGDRILHELCHILTDPLYCVALDRFMTKDVINNERERLTDTIAAIIRRLT